MQESVARIESQLSEYRRQMVISQAEKSKLVEKMEALSSTEAAARGEAKAARDELKRLRKDFLRVRDELTEEREERKGLVAAADEVRNGMMDKLGEMKALYERTKAELADSQAEAASRHTPAAFAEQVERVAAAESQVKEQQVVNMNLTIQLRQLEERLEVKEVEGRKAAADAEALVAELSRKLSLAYAMMAPEPMPRHHEVTVSVERSAYFLTEEGEPDEKVAAGGGGGNGGSLEVAQPLGLGANVPRALRWDKPLPLAPHTLEETEAAIADIWRSKRALEASQPPMTLHNFLPQYFRQKHSVGDIEGCARSAYSLYVAVGRLEAQSPVVRLFWRVWTGRLPEAAAQDQEALTTSLATLMQAAVDTVRAAAGQTGGCVLLPCALPRTRVRVCSAFA